MRAALGAIEDLTEATRDAPYATRVDSLTNTFNSRTSGDDLVVAALVADARTGRAGSRAVPGDR
ncbi:MAG: hypothetical protein J4F47_11455 [Alphaproteobacteria bacterium]|nr:hypothetical protein [Alphaproteobacteria bacterium]